MNVIEPRNKHLKLYYDHPHHLTQILYSMHEVFLSASSDKYPQVINYQYILPSHLFIGYILFYLTFYLGTFKIKSSNITNIKS